MDKLRSEILDSMLTDNLIEPADNYKVNKIVDDFKNLTKTEQILFLLRVSQASGSSSCQQRVEINETVTWLKANFVQDHMVALPKEEVYGMYKDHCNRQSSEPCSTKSAGTTKPVSTADFGKIVRQVFPEVKARRLGQRGNSRYCYANIRKKSKPDCPLLPEIISPSLPHVTVDQNSAGSKILKWANKIFGQEWETLTEFEKVLDNIEVGSPTTSSVAKRKRSSSSSCGNNSQGNASSTEKFNGEERKLPIPRLKREDSSASADEPEMQKYFCTEEKWPQLRQLLTTNKFTPIFHPPPANNTTKRRHYSTTTTYTTNPPINNFCINQTIDNSLLYMQPRSQSVPLANLFQSLSDDYYDELISSTPDSGFGSLSSTPRNPMLSSVSSDVIKPHFMDQFNDQDNIVNNIQSQIQNQLNASQVDTNADFFSTDFDSETNVFENLDFDVK